MKTRTLKPQALLLTALVGSSLLANENFIEIGAGFMNSKDNFSTENKSTNSSLDEAQSQSETIPLISFHYGHNLDDNNTVYAQAHKGDLSLGYKLKTQIGLFNVGAIYSAFAQEEWENPFALNTQRKETDVSEVGGYLSYGIPLNEAWFTNIKYQFTSVDYDKETVAKALRREGNRHILTWSNEVGPLLANVEYMLYDANGAQSSYKQYRFEVGSKFELSSKLSLMAMAGIGKKQYDERNQVLNEKIDATLYSVNSQLRYEEPFELKNTYTTLSVGHEQENANHDFYDKTSTYGMISIAYTF